MKATRLWACIFTAKRRNHVRADGRPMAWDHQHAELEQNDNITDKLGGDQDQYRHQSHVHLNNEITYFLKADKNRKTASI